MAGGMIAIDVVSLLFAVLLYGSSARAAIVVFERGTPIVGTLVSFVASVLVFLLTLIFEIAILHRIFPKPAPGKHPIMKSAAFWGWTLNFVLKRLLFFPPLKSLLFASNILRYLSLRALGCNVAFTASMSIDVDILDPSLTTIGAGATLGARAFVSSHYFIGKTLFLAPVIIGPRSLLSAETMCAPGVEIGEDAQVHTRSVVSVASKIGKGAIIQGSCSIDSKVVIAPGEKVEAGTIVRRPTPKA